MLSNEGRYCVVFVFNSREVDVAKGGVDRTFYNSRYYFIIGWLLVGGCVICHIVYL